MGTQALKQMQAELRQIPRSDEALKLLLPVAARYCHLLQDGTPRLDNRTLFDNYFKSLDCAMRFLLREGGGGSADIAEFAATIDLPRIDSSLPLLIEAFEQCRPLWQGERNLAIPANHPQPDLSNTFAILAYLGSQMYPITDELFLVSGYGDTFESDG